MQCQIAELMKQIAVQRVDGALQSLHGGDERLDDAAFQVERRVLAVQVILNQLADIALIELIGDSLPGLEIESGLIEATPQALAVLRDETRHQTAGHRRGHQKQSIEQSAQEQHHGAAGFTTRKEALL